MATKGPNNPFANRNCRVLGDPETIKDCDQAPGRPASRGQIWRDLGGSADDGVVVAWVTKL
jgi:hypothetical protein